MKKRITKTQKDEIIAAIKQSIKTKGQVCVIVSNTYSAYCYVSEKTEICDSIQIGNRTLSVWGIFDGKSFLINLMR